MHVVDLWPLQDVRTTGPLCQRSSPSAHASTTTSPWTFPSSTKRPSRSCTTSGCVSESRTTPALPYDFAATLHWESAARWLARCALSSRRHTLRQHVRLPGLVLRGRDSRHRLWPRHAVVPLVHPLFFRLLVQTTVRGLQVKKVIFI